MQPKLYASLARAGFDLRTERRIAPARAWVTASLTAMRRVWVPSRGRIVGIVADAGDVLAIGCVGKGEGEAG